MAKKTTQNKAGYKGQKPKPQQITTEIKAVTAPTQPTEKPSVFQDMELPNYNAGATPVCKELIESLNNLWSKYDIQELLKYHRGLIGGFKDIFDETNPKLLISEDWTESRVIYQEVFLNEAQKHLFNVKGIINGEEDFINKVNFFTKTLKMGGKANISALAIWAIENYFAKLNGNPEVVYEEESVPTTTQAPNNPIPTNPQTAQNSEQMIVGKQENQPVQPTVQPQQQEQPQQGLPLAQATFQQVQVQPEPNVVIPSAPVASVPFANPTAGVAQPYIAPQPAEDPRYRKLLSTGEKFIGLSHNPNPDEFLPEAKALFAKLADKLFELENNIHTQDAMYKEFHATAKQQLRLASMAYTSVLTCQK